jgi:hypothetical protein
MAIEYRVARDDEGASLTTNKFVLQTKEQTITQRPTRANTFFGPELRLAARGPMGIGCD